MTLRGLIGAGKLSEVLYCPLLWDRYGPQLTPRWREEAGCGGGDLYELGSHLIDQALCLLGLSEWIQAGIFVQRPGTSVEDGFEILLSKNRPRVGIGASSVSSGDGTHYCKVYGPDAAWFKTGLDVQDAQLRAGTSPRVAQFGVERRATWGTRIDNCAGSAETTRRIRSNWLQFYERWRVYL